MMDPESIMCFGGPLNERVVVVERDAPVLLAAMPERPAASAVQHPAGQGLEPPEPRMVEYRRGYVYAQSSGHLPLQIPYFVTRLYPEDRIADSIAGIVGLCALISGHGWNLCV